MRDTSNSFRYLKSRWAGLQKDSQASAVAFLESLDQVQNIRLYWKKTYDLLGQIGTICFIYIILYNWFRLINCFFIFLLGGSGKFDALGALQVSAVREKS